jgi:hypothetical protein
VNARAGPSPAGLLVKNNAWMGRSEVDEAAVVG